MPELTEHQQWLKDRKQECIDRHECCRILHYKTDPDGFKRTGVQVFDENGKEWGWSEVKTFVGFSEFADSICRRMTTHLVKTTKDTVWPVCDECFEIFMSATMPCSRCQRPSGATYREVQNGGIPEVFCSEECRTAWFKARGRPCPKFTEEEINHLVHVMRYGSAPIHLQDEKEGLTIVDFGRFGEDIPKPHVILSHATNENDLLKLEDRRLEREES